MEAASYHLGAGDVAGLQEGLACLAAMFFAAGARSVVPGVHGLAPRYDDAGATDPIRRAHLGAQDIPVGANHVFGTTAMGGDPRRHATDSVGAVYGLDDVHACDTGLFPSSPMVNPMLTAMALADRQAEVLAKRYRRGCARWRGARNMLGHAGTKSPANQAVVTAGVWGGRNACRVYRADQL